jgi:type IV pilus assembly protein PilP
VWGCDQASEPPAKPKVIRKKIIAKKDKPATSRDVKKATPSEPKADVRQQPQEPKTKSPTRIAKKDDAASAKKAKAKPAISPKSDIAAPQDTVAAPQPKPGADTEATQTIPESQTPAAGVKIAATDVPRYNPKGKIDPFEPLFKQKKVVAKTKTKKRKKRLPRTPLERIDLSQLKLVAIVRAKSGNRAMVEEASGKGYIISRGTYIGTNSGKVLKIQKNKVIVAEEIEDVMGNVSIRNTEIKLPKPPGEL